MALNVVTRELNTQNFELLKHLPKNPMTYVRGGDGLVGWGEAARLESRLPAGRMSDLAAQWRSLCADAEIENQMQLPGTGLVAFGSFAFADHSLASSVLIVPRIILGSRDGRVWLTSVSDSDQTNDLSAAEDFWSHPVEYPTNRSVVFEGGCTNTDKYLDLVATAVEKIAAGDLSKVVLSRDIQAVLPKDFDLRTVLQKLALQYPTCWVYSVDGMFGASPELLVRVAHAQVSARVLGGTAGRGTDPGVDQAIAVALAASSKNTAEHAFAVDSLVKSLEPFCTHVDADSVPFSLALPNVWHLASDVHGVLREDASVLDVAAALHPTAAVAGTPTNIAQDLIAQLEQNDRGRYAGPVGWIGSDGDGEWAIALRGAQIENSRGAQIEYSGGEQIEHSSESQEPATIRAFAGGGIVAESEPDAELAETELTLRLIREALS